MSDTINRIACAEETKVHKKSKKLERIELYKKKKVTESDIERIVQERVSSILPELIRRTTLVVRTQMMFGENTRKSKLQFGKYLEC